MKAKNAMKKWDKLHERVERLGAFHAQLLEYKIKEKAMVKDVEEKLKEAQQDLENFWKDPSVGVD